GRSRRGVWKESSKLRNYDRQELTALTGGNYGSNSVSDIMGVYFRKRRSLFGNLLSVNLSKSGVGLSVGVRGFRLGVSSSGRRYVTAGLPGSGIYYRHFTK